MLTAEEFLECIVSNKAENAETLRVEIGSLFNTVEIRITAEGTPFHAEDIEGSFLFSDFIAIMVLSVGSPGLDVAKFNK